MLCLPAFFSAAATSAADGGTIEKFAIETSGFIAGIFLRSVYLNERDFGSDIVCGSFGSGTTIVVSIAVSR